MHILLTALLACSSGASPLLADPAGAYLGPVQDPPTAGDEEVPAELVLTVGSHVRLLLPEDALRVAVGNEETASAELLSSKELLLLGLEPGVSSLMVWLENQGPQTTRLLIEPDLSLLRETLRELDPSLTVRSASAGRVLVLRGEVADPVLRDVASSVAVAFAEGRSQEEEPILDPENQARPGEAEESRARRRSSDSVVNLIRVRNLPDTLEVRLMDALEPISGESVTVRRVMQGELPSDDADLFILEGTVPDQVALTRVLFLASRVIAPENAGRQEIRALADESGALALQVQNATGAIGNGGGNQGGGNLNLTSSAGSGAPTLNSNTPLVNRIGTNLGRAKIHEAAGGRVLSMIEVEHLPLVRVDLRLYEVNLGRLRTWRNDLNAAWSDFDQPGIPPDGSLAQGYQGDLAATLDQEDVQNVLGFLDGGLSNQLQLVGGGFSVDNIFQLLVQEDVARTLSRPTLTVLSGELALFQVGGEVPIPVAVTVGGGTDQVLNGVEFRPFGIQLAVRPLVEEQADETITLDVSPLISLPDLDLTAAIGAATGTELGATAFETRGTLTHARLRDGEALVLGGLISREEAQATNKAPWLGDIPGLGWLFRNESNQARETELVIVVNPVIVQTPTTREPSMGIPGQQRDSGSLPDGGPPCSGRADRARGRALSS